MDICAKKTKGLGGSLLGKHPSPGYGKKIVSHWRKPSCARFGGVGVWRSVRIKYNLSQFAHSGEHITWWLQYLGLKKGTAPEAKSRNGNAASQSQKNRVPISITFLEKRVKYSASALHLTFSGQKTGQKRNRTSLLEEHCWVNQKTLGKKMLHRSDRMKV